MFEIALGEMNMHTDDFLNMLPKYFWRKMEGFYHLRNLSEKQNWERCRWQTCLLLNVHTEKGKSLKPTDLIKFDWDVQRTQEEKRTDKDYAEYIKKLEDKKLKDNGE